MPPGFREDPRPTIRSYREAPETLKGVERRLSHLSAIVNEIEKRFPELRDEAALGLRPFAGRSKNG